MLSLESILAGLGAFLGSLWLGSIEIRMRSIDTKLQSAPSRTEVSSEIEVRLEVVKVLQQEIKEDIRNLGVQINKLADKIS